MINLESNKYPGFADHFRHLIAHQPEWRAPSCVWPGPRAAPVGKGGAVLGRGFISLDAGGGVLPSGWFGSPRAGHVGAGGNALLGVVAKTDHGYSQCGFQLLPSLPWPAGTVW